ncbi:MAG: HAMP domain-containing protein [Bacteroidetes bacterium]|nr:HAMP domain-containing protein [Bacteroidota bacterium]
MRLKTKLSISLVFLFFVILLFGILGIFYITKLGDDLDQILKNNYNSLVYCNNMLRSLDNIRVGQDDIKAFSENLKNEQANISDVGERESTLKIVKSFDSLLLNRDNPEYYRKVRLAIYQAQEVNEMAILRKNIIARATSEDAKLVLAIIFSVLTLIAFSFIYNLPGIIAEPIRSLSEGITAIANKNYTKRIYLKQKDEFGDLANAFNVMAGKLDEYESSNLAKIKFEKSRIETIINQMRDGILGLDEKRKILFLNAVAEKLLGLKEVDIIGKYAPDIALSNDLMRTLLQEHPIEEELKIFADNKESYFNRDVLEVMNNEQMIGTVIVMRNITPFHELNEAKTNFIATVSHELKTPISSIKMSAQLLTDERICSLNHEQKELSVSIQEDAERLLKITGELLNMAQVETGNIQLKIQGTSPESIVDQSLSAVQFQAQQKNISLQKNIQPNLPYLNADAEKTTWVLINFITNAIKFSPEKSKIEINVFENGDSIDFIVRDYGKGIEEKYQPRIFDRYFKVPGSHDRTGTGLGLAISKEFIEAQGGRIWVDSKINEGSSFGFSFKKI